MRFHLSHLKNPNTKTHAFFSRTSQAIIFFRNVILREALTTFPMHRIVTLVFIKIARNEPVCDPLVPLRWTGALTRIAESGSVLAKAIRERREANAYAAAYCRGE